MLNLCKIINFDFSELNARVAELLEKMNSLKYSVAYLLSINSLTQAIDKIFYFSSKVIFLIRFSI